MRKISQEEKKYLLSLKPDDFTFDLLEDLLGNTCEKKDGKLIIKESKFTPSDTFTLEAKEYFNKTKIETTVGLFIFNKILIEGNFEDTIGYINHTIRNSDAGDIENEIAQLLLDNKITRQKMVDYINKFQWLGMRIHPLICSSFTPKTFKPLPEVIALRDKLFEEHKEQLEAGDVILMDKIEKQLIEKAKEVMGDDPGLTLYDSGARGSFKNNYKMMCITQGSSFNPYTGKNEIIKNCFLDGFAKKDIPIAANELIAGVYPKSVGTGVSGYFTKQILAALQATTINDKVEDCKTKSTIPIKIDKSQTSMFHYKYIIENGKLVMLTKDNINKYIGKTVKMRSAMACPEVKICKVCAGRMYEKMDIQNIGLTASKPSSALTNLGMKKFHDPTITIAPIDISDITI